MANSNQEDQFKTFEVRYLKPNFFKRIYVAIENNPWKFIVGWFLAYTAIWAVLEPINAFFPTYFTDQSSQKYILMIVGGFLIAVWYRFPVIKTSFELKGSNTCVEILFGNIFSQDGDIALAVNEYFDYDFSIIKKFTLHGKFIEQFYGQNPREFAADMDQKLEDIGAPATVVERLNSKGNRLSRNKKYPIGTTIVVEKFNTTYFLFALTKNTSDQGTEANVQDLWQALQGLWDEVRQRRNSDIINIPLVGSGFSDVGLPDQLLLQIILSSILSSTKARRFAKVVRIVLAPDKIDSIQLEKLRAVWSL